MKQKCGLLVFGPSSASSLFAGFAENFLTRRMKTATFDKSINFSIFFLTVYESQFELFKIYGPNVITYLHFRIQHEITAIVPNERAARAHQVVD